MCYAGCKYENYYGDCTLDFKEKFPEDASCIIHEKEIDEFEKIRNKERINLVVDRICSSLTIE